MVVYKVHVDCWCVGVHWSSQTDSLSSTFTVCNFIELCNSANARISRGTLDLGSSREICTYYFIYDSAVQTAVLDKVNVAMVTIRVG